MKKLLDKFKIITAFIVGALMLFVSAFVFNNPQKQTVQAQIEISSKNNTFTKQDVLQAKTVNVNMGSSIEKMDMEQYLIGVVAGEVYPTYSPEALKAQAVAARTYLMYKISGGGCNNGGDICVESGHCQAYKTKEKMLSQWGGNYEKYYNAIKDAVYQTMGEIVIYDNKPICALYHSSSVGKTEDCVSVFGGNRPYLKSVSSYIGTDNQEYSKNVTFTKKQFLQKINQAFNLNLNEIQIKITSYTSAGRVSTLKIGEKTVKATEIRKALALRSTDFTFENTGEAITFTMKGYGHGVGLSQAGAQEMAKQGKTYKEILTHYYTGTTVEKI